MTMAAAKETMSKPAHFLQIGELPVRAMELTAEAARLQIFLEVFNEFKAGTRTAARIQITLD
jgi:hypothetical protein